MRPMDDAAARLDEALARVRQALVGLGFGSVTVTVQDGVVVQIERTEKLRLARPTRER